MPPKGYKKPNPKPKKTYKQKSIALISSLEDGWSWSYSLVLLESGAFKNRSHLTTRRNKEEYKKHGYKALHPEDRGWHMRIGKRNLTKKEISKRYNDTHKEDIKKRCQNYRKENVEWSKEQTHKRRGMGFIPLNESFAKSEAHHIDNEHVIYIPTKLHHSVYHCLKSGVGMKEINMKAFGFLLRKQLLSEHNG